MKNNVYQFYKAYWKQNKRLPDNAYILRKVRGLTLAKLVVIKEELIKEGKLKQDTKKTVKINTESELKNSIVIKVELVYSVICFSVALGCVYGSFGYSIKFLSTYIDDLFTLYAVTYTATIAAVVWPDIVFYLFRLRGFHYIIAVFIVLVGLIVTLSSMLFTVAGQYDKLAEKTSSKESVTFSFLKSEITQLKKEESELEETLHVYRETLRGLSGDKRTEAGGGYYITTKRDLGEKEEALNILRGYIKVKSKELLNYSNTHALNKYIDFYEWMGDALNRDPVKLSFWHKLSFAIILDIIGPLFLSLGFWFFKRRY